VADDLGERIGRLSPAKLALLEQWRRRRALVAGGGQAIPRRVGTAPPPLSFAQQRLWFLHQLAPRGSAYNMPRAVRLQGALDIEALRKALDALVRRHETLRTTFKLAQDEPVQVIGAIRSLDLRVVDLSARAEPERSAELGREMRAEACRPFNLEVDLMLRALLVRQAAEDHVLLLTFHHIASDAWSAGVFSRELGALYTAFTLGREAVLPALPIQYADYAVWQREWVRGEVLERQLAYWKQQLGGAPDLLALPTDRPRPPVPSDRGQPQPWRAAEGLAGSVRELSRREGVTVFMTLLAAFQALLCLHAKQEDIVVGSPIANRERVETEGLIGFLVNTLVLRTDLSRDPTFRVLLRRVHDVALGAYAHREVPFEMVVDALQPTRALSHNPLFQVWFRVQTGERATLQLPGLMVSPMDVGHEAVRHDLRLGIVMDSQGLRGTFEYRTDLFEPATIAIMAGHFDTLLERVVADPDVRLSGLLAFMEEVDRRRQAVAEQELTEAGRRRLRDARRKAVGA
jgi:hypothetical protein